MKRPVDQAMWLTATAHTGGDLVSHFTESVSRWLRRRRAVTREEFAEVADWVNEGGALDPTGPPPLIEDEDHTDGFRTGSTAHHHRRSPIATSG
jgi:hypothetical protein